MRKPKSEVSAWIVEQRKRHDPAWKSEELAKRLGVAESTVRGWESGRTVSGENLIALERLFGVEAPGSRQGQAGDGDVAAAIRDQTEVMRELVEELRQARLDRKQLRELEAQVRELQFRVVEAPAIGDRDLDELQAEAEATMSTRPTRNRPATAGGSGQLREVPGG